MYARCVTAAVSRVKTAHFSYLWTSAKSHSGASNQDSSLGLLKSLPKLTTRAASSCFPFLSPSTALCMGCAAEDNTGCGTSECWYQRLFGDGFPACGQSDCWYALDDGGLGGGEHFTIGQTAGTTWNNDAGTRARLDSLTLKLKFVLECCNSSLEKTHRLEAFHGKKVLDIGCGAGHLAEAMVKEGAEVVGLDTSKAAIKVAMLHRDSTFPSECGSRLIYQNCDLAHLAICDSNASRQKFDLVVASDVVEHQKNPVELMAQMAATTRDGGAIVLTTINKTAAAKLFSISQPGTHHYEQLVSPASLKEAAETLGLEHIATQGTLFVPFFRRWYPIPSAAVTYMIAFRKK